MLRQRPFLTLIALLFTLAVGGCSDLEPLPDSNTPDGTADPVEPTDGLLPVEPLDPAELEGDEPEFLEDVLVAPPSDGLEWASADQRYGQPQVVYVNFDGPVISDCSNYCSDATTNRSFALGAHFGKSSIDFAPYGTTAQRNDIINKLRASFAPWEVKFTTSRPASGPYTMLVISTSTTGPAHGVAPLNCGNTNPNDIAFVYKAGSVSTAWVAQASAHELGHSFGLAHVTNGNDFMHWHATGNHFTRATYDSAHANAKCMDSNTQDGPAMLYEALAVAPSSCSQVSRIAGSDRFSTAAAVSRSVFSSATKAIVTLGSDLAPDALAAGPLARKLGGPVLLTSRDQLPEPTLKELRRLGVKQVIITGGTGAVSDAVANKLRSEGMTVTRLSGSSRYDTAARIAREVGAANGLAFIASGEDKHLFDALAASGPAAALGAPILLVSRDTMPQATRDALSDLGVTRTLVVGGPGSISDAVMAKLPSPTRLAGPSRYDTAAAVAEEARKRGLSTENVFVARGDRMPDALAAGAAGRILILSAPDHLPQAPTWFLVDHGQRATLLGGSGALSGEVERAACGALLH